MNMLEHLPAIRDDFNVMQLSKNFALVQPRSIPELGLLVDVRSDHNLHQWNISFPGLPNVSFRLVCLGECCKRKIDEFDPEFLQKVAGTIRRAGIRIVAARNANGWWDTHRIMVWDGEVAVEGSVVKLLKRVAPEATKAFGFIDRDDEFN